MINLVRSVNDTETEMIAKAERAFLHRVNGACDTPIGVNAVVNDDNELFLRAELLSLDGSQHFIGHKTGLIDHAEKIGLDVAEEVLYKAGSDFVLRETKLAHTINQSKK